MNLPLLQLVDAPDQTANVLYDLHVDPSQFVDRNGLDWGSAPWIANPGSVGGRDGYRTLALTHQFGAERSDAEYQLGILARVLRRPEVYLRVRISPTSQCRYFRLWRSPIGSISPDQVFLSQGDTVGIYAIALQLTADPYLLGELVTLPTIAINNDPAALSNPMWTTLPTIEGDGPAPLIAKFSKSGAAIGGTSFISVSQAPPSGGGPYFIQVGIGDACIAGADCGAGAADSTMSGGSARSVNFATVTAMDARVSAPIPNTLPAGEYRVLVRSKHTNASSGDPCVYTFQAAAVDPTGAVSTALDPVRISRIAGEASPAWLDLGTTFVWPMGHDSSRPSAGATGYISLSAAVSAGGNPTPSWTVDVIALVPVGVTPWTTYSRETAAKLTAMYFGGGFMATLDGESQWLTAQKNFYGNAGVAGVFPVVEPGQLNVLTFVSGIYGAGVDDDITSVADLDLSYYPRYDWPAP